MGSANRLTVAECAQLACVLEATARKPGNVTRFNDFDDLTYLDFALSAMAIAPVMERAAEIGVGRAVLDGVRATQRFVSSNSNLGILLLLAPLAAVRGHDLEPGVVGVLDRLTVEDSRHVFEAIRLARPGGLGDAPREDVRAEPSLPLRAVMALAAERDLIARQYADGFRAVFDIGVPALRGSDLEAAIIRCHLTLVAAFPDSHIVRRCGPDLGEEARRRAAEVLASRESIASFDAWLRADGHRRNPGACADLVAASLFVALRRGMIDFPAQW